jgi:hypothetical protein
VGCSRSLERFHTNWLFAGSLRAGQRSAAIMSLVHPARINGHEPHAYLKGVMERPFIRSRQIASVNCCRIAGSHTRLTDQSSVVKTGSPRVPSARRRLDRVVVPVSASWKMAQIAAPAVPLPAACFMHLSMFVGCIGY